MSRLPIFRDDQSFREQTERMFREMEEKMGFHHNPHSQAAFQDLVGGGTRWPPTFDDSSFFQLRPFPAVTHPVLLFRFCFAPHTVLYLAVCIVSCKVKKAAHTRLPSVGFRSWSRFLAVSLQETWVINPAVSGHYFPPCLQLPSQPLRGLLPISLLGEQRHDGCEQFA